MHTTKHFNGWVGENPKGYTTKPTIHSWIDGGYFKKTGGLKFDALVGKIHPAEKIANSSNRVMEAIIPSANAAGADDQGKKLYDTSCMACHAAGVAGAPKFGDKAAWAPRIAQGADTLHTHAIKGYQGKAGMMPPKGGNMSAKDEDIKAAVDYMVNAAK